MQKTQNIFFYQKEFEDVSYLFQVESDLDFTYCECVLDSHNIWLLRATGGYDIVYFNYKHTITELSVEKWVYLVSCAKLDPKNPLIAEAFNEQVITLLGMASQLIEDNLEIKKTELVKRFIKAFKRLEQAWYFERDFKSVLPNLEFPKDINDNPQKIRPELRSIVRSVEHFSRFLRKSDWAKEFGKITFN